jgi:hypothetical protein
MRIKDVVTLKEVVSDLNDGKAFYDQRKTGVGDYFWDSLIADIESLKIYAGIHNIEKGGLIVPFSFWKGLWVIILLSSPKLEPAL